MHEPGQGEGEDAAGARPPGELSPELRRDQDNGVLTGVCAGLASYTRIDPVVWRTGFFVTAFAGGTGLWLYLAAWAMMRDAQGRPALVEQLLNRGLASRAVPALLGGGLALAALLSLAGGVSWGTLVLAVPLVLAVLAARNRGVDVPGLYRDLPHLLRSEQTPPERPEPPPEPTFTNPTAPWTAVPEGPVDLRLVSERAQATGADYPEPRWASSAEDTTPTHQCGRPALAPLVFLAILVGAGVALALAEEPSMAALVAPGPGTVFLGGVIVLIASALLLGAWFGSRRGLLTLGTLAVLVAVTATAVDLTALRFGEVTWRPTTVDQAEVQHRLTGGKAVLNLTGLDLERDDELSVDAGVGLGTLEVLLPPEAEVQLDGQVGLGKLTVEETTRIGLNVIHDDLLVPASSSAAEAERGDDPEEEPAPSIELSVRSYGGEVLVKRGS